jgi:hypothetical protein
MELGTRAVGARTGADATSILLAAYSAAVARVFGRDPSVALVAVNKLNNCAGLPGRVR